MTKKNPYINLDSIKKDKKTDDTSTVKNTPMTFEEKYNAALDKAGIERPEKSDYEKDMEKYSPSIKAGMEVSRQRNKDLAENRDTPKTHRTIEAESMVKTSKSGYAEAETKEQTKAPTGKNSAKAQKNRPSRMDRKGSNLEKTGSSTSEKSTKKPTEKAPAKVPKGGYPTEKQDVNGIDGYTAKTTVYNNRVSSRVKDSRPKASASKPLTVSQLRNEYQVDLMHKHKREMADLEAGLTSPKKKEKPKEKVAYVTNKKATMAQARNEYQQMLIKKHKKEMSGK